MPQSPSTILSHFDKHGRTNLDYVLDRLNLQARTHQRELALIQSQIGAVTIARNIRDGKLRVSASDARPVHLTFN